jgi:LysM repeat protein
MLKQKWLARHRFAIVVLALVFSFAGFGPAVKTARAIDYTNCAQLYAVQPGDTLADVARISATTEQFVLSRNDLSSADDIYPGLVLCLEDADNGGGIIPPTGGRSGLEVTNVSPGESVAVQGTNFREGATVNVYMFEFGVQNPNVVSLGSLTVPAGGMFERTLIIPASLQSVRNVTIRFRNADENVAASTTFVNANVDRVAPDECADYYTVRSGDVLGIIAQEVNVPVQRLIDLNNLIDPNVIYPGQLLCTKLK